MDMDMDYDQAMTMWGYVRV